MSELANIVLRAMFLENLALVFLLGMCTYIAVSKRVATAIGLGIAVIVVQLITVPVNNLIYQFVLDLSYLKFVTFIGVIAALVQMLEVAMERFTPVLHQTMGIYLPLLTVNCAILGASLLMVQRSYDFTGSLAYGVGTGLGWALAVVLFAAIRERLRYSDVPVGLQGLGIAFIVTGLLAFGFAGLTGIEF